MTQKSCKYCNVLFLTTRKWRYNCDLHYRMKRPDIEAERARKISESRMGKKRAPFSEEWKKKLGDGLRKMVKEKVKGVPKSDVTKEKLRQARLKQVFTPEQKRKSMEALMRSNKLHVGSNHYNWKGGITPENERIRNSATYARWRTSVFQRDKYTCVFCGQMGGYLQADHIKPFALFPDARFDLNNGRTLCVPCHRTTDTYGIRSKRTIASN